MNNSIKIFIDILGLLFVLTAPMIDVKANEYYKPLDGNDKALIKEMFKPLFNVLDLIPYFATVAAVLYVLYAGFNMITAGYDNEKKKQTKGIIVAVILGLGLVWAAPSFVDYLLT